MDLTFTAGRDRFNVRVAAVVIARDRLLLNGARAFPFSIPPGGRCTLHEPIRAALARELREELGREVALGRLLWLVENFFDLDGFAVHELTFLFAAELADDDPLAALDGEFPGAEPADAGFYRWFPLADLAGLEVYPQILRTRCASLPTATEHLVVDQRDA